MYLNYKRASVTSTQKCVIFSDSDKNERHVTLVYLTVHIKQWFCDILSAYSRANKVFYSEVLRNGADFDDFWF